MKRLELLAPAKNLEIGIAAISCGADAVYIAGEKFGAREKAGNKLEDIVRLCDFAHKFGAKVYVTINTILKESELQEAQNLIWECCQAGVDAIIVQDLGILKLKLPPIDLIASTQCDIRTPEKAKWLESLGFTRLILARELSLRQIEKISEAVKCELEFFVHGALCVSYSGQCYLSEYLIGRSANRGECSQPCRNLYDLIDGQGKILIKNKPLLSLKDLNLSNNIQSLIDAGITSFKIEGRLKNISYVKNIVTLYNKKINEVIETRRGEYCRASFGRSQATFNPQPFATFNRGYTNYFLNGEKREERTVGLNSRIAKYLGEPIGEVLQVSPNSQNTKKREIKYKAETNLHNGDGVSFIVDNENVIGARVNSVTDDTASLLFSDPLLSDKVNLKGKTIYRNFDFLFEKEIETLTKRQIEVSLKIVCRNNILEITPSSNHPVLERIFRKKQSSYLFETESYPSQNISKCREIIQNQISKESGVFRFNVVEIEGEIKFYRAAVLNKIRRELAEMLSEVIVKNFRESAGYQTEEKKNKFGCEKTIKEAMTSYLTQNGRLSYLANSANSKSRAVYSEAGYDVDKYLPSEKNGKLLMRTKYCLRYEIGMCLKTDREQTPLYLINNGRKLSLKFDCNNCEMLVEAE